MNRRDLGMACLGIAAGIAQCSGPVQSLLVPQAEASDPEESAVSPHSGFELRYVLAAAQQRLLEREQQRAARRESQ
jgi:hypothetical protein